MNEALLTYRGTVYPWHCDHVGHMKVMWYVGKFDEATWHLFHAIGLTRPYLQSAQRGMAAVDQHISYLQELHAGAVVSVRTRVLEVKERSLRFEHEMTQEQIGNRLGVSQMQVSRTLARVFACLRERLQDEGPGGESPHEDGDRRLPVEPARRRTA